MVLALFILRLPFAKYIHKVTAFIPNGTRDIYEAEEYSDSCGMT